MKQFKNFLKSLQYIYYNQSCVYELAQANVRIFPVFTFLCSVFLISQVFYDIYLFVEKRMYVFLGLYGFIYLFLFLLLLTTNAKIKNMNNDFIHHIDDIMDATDCFSIIFLIAVACLSILDVFSTGTFQSLTIGCMALGALYFNPRKVLPTLAIICILVYLFSAAYRGVSLAKCNALFHNFITTCLLLFFIMFKYYLKIQNELSRKECQKYKDRMNQATLSKTKFLSNVTQYLDSPTDNILSVLENMKEPVDQDISYHQILELSTYAKEISCFIDNIKEINTLDGNHSLFTPEPIYLPDFMNELKNMFQVLCDDKHQKLEIDLSQTRHYYVNLCKYQVKQILINLIMNAVSYTPMGGYVCISICELEDMTGAMPRFQFIIEDNGIGMTDEFINKIYYPFARAEDIILDEVSGAGIGMTVVKHLLDELHGSIDISSLPNVGTEITISLDLTIAKEPEKEHDELNTEKEIAS